VVFNGLESWHGWMIPARTVANMVALYVPRGGM
jgi:hypothetical protein